MNGLERFSLAGQTAVITGGSGVLGRTLALGLADAGARVVIIGRRLAASEEVAAAIRAAGGIALAVAADVLDPATLRIAEVAITASLGPVDILVNGAGGNQPEATATPEMPWYTLAPEAIEAVWRVNFTGAVHCAQIFGRGMVERGQGCIINIASLSALRPLTRVGMYGAAKAALVNFTQWLAVTVARESSPLIRVNALAPGFFLTEQNRYLLTDRATGQWTERGAAIVAHTPQGRLGEPDDLVGALVWLASPAARFVTGIVVPVDGGFAAFSGV